MRQRNDTGYPQHVSAWPTDDEPDRAPFDMGVGEEVDWPTPLAGFTNLDRPEPAADDASEAATTAEVTAQSASTTKAPSAKSTRKSTAAAATPEGGEPR